MFLTNLIQLGKSLGSLGCKISSQVREEPWRLLLTSLRTENSLIIVMSSSILHAKNFVPTHSPQLTLLNISTLFGLLSLIGHLVTWSLCSWSDCPSPRRETLQAGGLESQSVQEVKSWCSPPKSCSPGHLATTAQAGQAWVSPPPQLASPALVSLGLISVSGSQCVDPKE